MPNMIEMQTYWDYRLIALSVIIAIFGSFIALDFAGRMKLAEGAVRRFWFVSGALTMGLAIWSMHFIGMLALVMPMPVTYNESLVTLSVLAAVIGSGIAFSIMNRQTLSRLNLSAGGIAMGLAIATMHYTGMASMKMAATIHYNPFLFFISLIIAITASAAALWLAFQMRTDKQEVWFWQKVGSAVVMGCAISCMHYTGMAAARYYHTGTMVSELNTIASVGVFKLSDLLIAASILFGMILVLLTAQIGAERQKALEIAQKLTDELEQRVRERTEQLEIANSALKISEERFRLLIETVKDYAIYRIDPNGIIQTWNQGAENLKGYLAAEIIGEHFSKFYTPEAIQQNYPAYELKMAQEQGHFEDEGWRIRKDGRKFWANVTITALYDSKDNLIGFTKITRDLTEQKLAEEKLQASERQYRELSEALQSQSTQMETVNKELEAFSYSVSHDLRAPLRGIDGFSQALLEQYGDQLDEQGKHYLNRVRNGSQQMGKLIDDMLQLSRVTRGEMAVESADLSTMAKNITQEIQRQNPERQIEYIIAEGLIVQGDKRLLQAVLQNLFDNAWKYTSKHATARIEFGVTPHEGQVAYFVKDDGAGFDMQYAGKLFGAFQRLHGASEFPGTGVGLATVARIIHRHGGEIWVQAEVEKGATFYFTLENAGNGKEA